MQSLFQSVYNKFPIERPIGSEIAKSRGAKALALCKAKTNDRTQRTPLYGSALRE
ncbi:hypothetical protein LSS_20725 [Leptospira santarosai serovar Shermani str. LT 821]|uniref:Uncharacterized protein n=1 Tax=Leptospira santarosai serovar Shermani str. LT 821 TaxID=758847 RepID=A0A097ES93_9LEPT|nr:hypothetical protein LSS_20725 [Leptospira santarosai serovar Shermani str. LT 821]